MKRALATAGIAGLALVSGACGNGEKTSNTTVPVDQTTTIVEPTTAAAVATTTKPTADAKPRSTAPPATPAPTSPKPTSPPTPQYGAPCSLGGSADCIDPDGNGQGTYLKGGAACMNQMADSPELCSDLDGDGSAGYPDAG